jgi:chromosome segregation ATPase
MSSEDEEIRVTLRLSSGLRDRLASSAAHHSRSMNGEIIARLESSFDSNIDPQSLADAYAAAQNMRELYETRLGLFEADVQTLENERRNFATYIREKRIELAGKIRARHAREDERLQNKWKSIDTRTEHLEQETKLYRERMDRLIEDEKALDATLDRLRKRETELGDVIRNLSENAAKLKDKTP